MQLLQSFFEQFAYLGVFLTLLAGSLGLPIPEEMVILAAGLRFVLTPAREQRLPSMLTR